VAAHPAVAAVGLHVAARAHAVAEPREAADLAAARAADLTRCAGVAAGAAIGPVGLGIDAAVAADLLPRGARHGALPAGAELAHAARAAAHPAVGAVVREVGAVRRLPRRAADRERRTARQAARSGAAHLPGRTDGPALAAIEPVGPGVRAD